MSAWTTTTRTEFSKLLSRKKYIVLLILGAGFCFLRLGGSILLEKLSRGMV